MKPERWQELEKLFQDALTQPPEKRAHVLENVADHDLRRQVEALLAAHEQAGTFIESPAFDVEALNMADLKESNNIAGTVVSHYRILEPLGAGGMGEVYLAQDVSLGRQVALKFLPSDFTADAERLRRFEQEARAASSLNHPNILTIYEIGESDSGRYIASEFIDGVTLRERISGKPMKIDEAIDIAVQVADALISAHSKGIVHRDIKPENIMISDGGRLGQKEGHVKVLDFGIAKLTETQTIETDLPTRPLLNTSEGITIGTAPYMSPEQAEGAKVDARTDIWSLSVVLYEMLSGRVPFDGATRSRLIVSILEKEPRPLSELVDNIPPAIGWIVKKGLRKEKEDRYQSAREFFSDLREFQKQESASKALGEHAVALPASDVDLSTIGQSTSAPTASGITREITAPPTSRGEYIVGEIRRHKLGVLITAAILLLILSGLGYGLLALWRHNQATPTVSSQAMKITRLTDNGKATAAGISPDGNYVVYVRDDEGKVGLWLRQVGQATEREIVSPMDGQIVGPTFSRDGSLIYYTASSSIAERGVLYQVPALGGTSRKVLEDISGPVGLSRDGKRLAFIRSVNGPPHIDSLIVANVDGTGERILLRKEGQAYLDTGPNWSPDDKTIVCGAGVGPDFRFESIVVIPLNGEQERWVTSYRWRHISRAVWLGDGSGLMVLAIGNATTESQLWHVSNPGGEVQRVTNDLNGYLQDSVSITADSSALVAAQEDSSSRIWVNTLGEGEDRARQITNGKFDGLNGVAWTPDGKILCVLKTGDDFNIWLMNRDGTERKQLTADSSEKRGPKMSPDGRHIVFSALHDEVRNIWKMDADGSKQKQLTKGAWGDFVTGFTPDGQWVVFWSWTESGSAMISKVSIEGGEPVQLTSYWSIWPTISSDGKLIAAGYLDEQHSPHLAIIPSLGGQPIKLLPFPSAMNPSFGFGWTADSNSLVYAQKHNGVSNIWSQPIDGSPPKQLTNFKSDVIFKFALSPDGRQLVLARGTQTRDIVIIRDFR